MPEPAPAVATSAPAEPEAGPAGAAALPLARAPASLPDPAAEIPSPEPVAADWAAQASLFEREARRREGGREAAELFLEAGRLRAERLGDLPAAEALWRAAAAADPGHAPAALAAARAELARATAEGRDEDRLRALERCADLCADDPQHAAALLATAAAVAEERLGRDPLAADLALRAFELAPGDAALRRDARRHAEREGRSAALARVLLAEASDPGTAPRDAGLAACAAARLLCGPLDDPGEAALRLTEARQRGGGDAAVLEAVAALHEERGEWELAASALRARAEARAGTPGETLELVAGQLRLAEICEERLGRADEAVACYEGVLAVSPGHRSALAALGRLFARAGAWEKLLANFVAERDAAVDPREKAHRAFKAGEVLEERLLRPAEAVERYREALALDPALWAARQALERLYEAEGRHAELAALLEDALARTDSVDERIAGLMRLARLQDERLRDGRAAAAAWERVLELAPDHTVALRALAALHDREGRFAELVAVNERLLSLTRDRPAALALLQRTAEVQEEQLGDAGAAATTLERMLALDPTHRPALRALGRLYAASDRWAELVRMFRSDADAAPSPEAAADLHFRAAELLERRAHEEAGALAGYREALTLAPGHLGALGAVARLERARGSWERLVEALRDEAAVHTAPERRAALLCEVAEVWETRLGDAARALEALEEALAIVPTHAPALRALDRLLSRLGRHAELAERWRAHGLVASGADRTSALLRAARLLGERLGQREAALEACQAALAAAPDDASARLLLEMLRGAVPASPSAADTSSRVRAAEAHEDRGELARAAEVLHEALVAAPGSLPAVTALARVAARRGEPAEARNALRSEAALLHDGAAAAAALVAAGELSSRLADAAGAAADLAAALERDPSRADAAASLAALLARAPSPAELAGGADRALRAAEAALALDPAQPDALRVRARLHAEAGRAADAARDLSALLVAGCEDADAVHLELADLHAGPLADPARALSHLQAAASGGPQAERALERLAALHRRAENWPGAADALRRLVALPPLAPQARRRHLLALAELRAAAFGDRGAAAELCDEARRLAPDDPDVAAAVARHRAAVGPAAPATAASGGAAGALLAEERRLLAEDPGRLESWRALFRLFRAARELDRALVVNGVLRFFDAAEPEAAASPRPESAGAPPALGEADWLLLRHPLDRGPLSDVLRLAADALAEVAQLPAPARESGRAEALAPLVEEACRALGVRPFAVRCGGDPAGLTLAPGDPPVAYAGAELLRGAHPQPAQRFLVARAAARVRAGSALAARLPAAALGELLAAAVRLVAPDDASLGVPREALARAVGRAVPRKALRALDEPVRALALSGAPDVAGWQKALSASADRCGLLLCGDAAAALRVVLRESGPAAATAAELVEAARSRPALRDLLLFAASDDHFRLRERLRLARPAR